MERRIALESEREIVERLLGLLSRGWRCGSLGPGDDAACLGAGWERLLLKIDGGSVEQNLAPWMSLRDLGWVAAVSAISDLAAKAAKPLALAISVGLPPGWGAVEAEEIVGGAAEAAEAHGAWLSGGDTNASPRGGGWVDVAAVGVAAPEWGPVPRRGRPGDLVYTTLGRYGLMGMLWRLLEEGDAWRRWASRLPEAFGEARRPLARLGFADLASRLPRGCIGGSIDVSDGFAVSLYLLSRASGAPIVLERLPEPHPAARVFSGEEAASLEELILYGGQEYEVVFTVEPGCAGRVEGEAEGLGLPVERVGRLAPGEEAPGVYYRGVRLQARGWDNILEARGCREGRGV